MVIHGAHRCNRMTVAYLFAGSWLHGSTPKIVWGILVCQAQPCYSSQNFTEYKTFSGCFSSLLLLLQLLSFARSCTISELIGNTNKYFYFHIVGSVAFLLLLRGKRRGSALQFQWKRCMTLWEMAHFFPMECGCIRVGLGMIFLFYLSCSKAIFNVRACWFANNYMIPDNWLVILYYIFLFYNMIFLMERTFIEFFCIWAISKMKNSSPRSIHQETQIFQSDLEQNTYSNILCWSYEWSWYV